ncbi:hypothetical protein [Legionella londiniensis]|uniref:Transmembrane protein n=1 Tax=Legionella londiniensis TaxID=45068 RepID=A0A0W0VNR6_9GAMM|nr:hypothetical protein [Legionella londiniensis]KTD21722.1 transmembrane protein [Legionella londiniensis]STX93442.1 transmembrane protein [Legionella londiniensis]
MEKNRYQQNHTLYIVCMINLVISIALFSFTLYLLPFLLFGWIYDVPEFVLTWREWMELRYEMTNLAASGFIFTVFFIFGLITAFIAYITSNKIENEIFGIKTENRDREIRIKREARETASVLSKIVMIIILVFIAVVLLEWFLYVPPVRQL